MLIKRRRRWANIRPVLGSRLVFAGELGVSRPAAQSCAPFSSHVGWLRGPILSNAITHFFEC